MARSKVFGPEAPPKKPAPKRVPHGPEKPPKPKTFGPPPPPRYGPEEPPPPPTDYQETMLRLRKKHGGRAPGPWKLDEAQEFETVKTLRGPLTLGAMAGQKLTEAYMEPAIQEETDRVMRQYGTAGNLVGSGGILAQSMSPKADRGALMAAGVDAGVTIAQALLAARAGRAKEAAGMFALGLADMVGPAAVPGPPTRRGTNAHLKQQAQVAGVLGYDAGVTMLQEKLQAYANETGNKQLSQELKALAADPERLKQTIQK